MDFYCLIRAEKYSRRRHGGVRCATTGYLHRFRAIQWHPTGASIAWSPHLWPWQDLWASNFDRQPLVVNLHPAHSTRQCLATFVSTRLLRLRVSPPYQPGPLSEHAPHSHSFHSARRGTKLSDSSLVLHWRTAASHFEFEFAFWVIPPELPALHSILSVCSWLRRHC